MPMPHPLNQAVIAQALHDLRTGQLRRCKSMGFEDQDLAALKQPKLLSVLLNARVSWCTVSINHAVLQRLLSQAEDMDAEIARVDHMLQLGASTEMVNAFYGLTHQEVGLRRDMLGLPKRKGRHPVLSEAEDIALWHGWKRYQQAHPIDCTDDMALLHLTLELAGTLGHPASVIWATVRGWISQGLV
ncbi:DUF2857 domain-containing protein [Pseudomonas fluorescens]|uniref:DUF2857 domain-containing protein n=1 Tax=Pseudomonas fluorescens TaxID=294 RepID=UPI001BE98333|nr:DUF2857 domain-containing protein [Pseudomonas fluorescens]MBT2375403.1 DUF2857 domain-containing protein [Pseudomonas fluorescens]